jgi:hypothetical protein
MTDNTCTCCGKRPKKEGNRFLCRICERKNPDSEGGHRGRKVIHPKGGKS